MTLRLRRLLAILLPDRRLGRWAALVFAGMFALQGAVAAGHVHLDDFGADPVAAAASEPASAPEGPRPAARLELCEVCLTASAFTHAPPASAPVVARAPSVPVRPLRAAPAHAPARPPVAQPPSRGPPAAL